MKNLTPKHVLLFLITAAIVIPLLIYGWNEIHKQPINMFMYGAEIKADGTVIRETEFRLEGYLKDYQSGREIRTYEFYLKPITFKGIPSLTLQMDSFDSDLILWQNVSAHVPNYCTFWLTYSQTQNAPVDVELYWCSQFCCCVIKTEGRYFVGSTAPEFDVQTILATFPELEME